MDGYKLDVDGTSYGKTGVKLLFVRRDRDRHDIVEFEGMLSSHPSHVILLDCAGRDSMWIGCCVVSGSISIYNFTSF